MQVAIYMTVDTSVLWWDEGKYRRWNITGACIPNLTLEVPIHKSRGLRQSRAAAAQQPSSLAYILFT